MSVSSLKDTTMAWGLHSRRRAPSILGTCFGRQAGNNTRTLEGWNRLAAAQRWRHPELRMPS